VVSFIPQRVFYRGPKEHHNCFFWGGGRHQNQAEDFGEKKNLLLLPEIELRFLGCPAHNPSDIMLSYHGSGWKDRASYGWK